MKPKLIKLSPLNQKAINEFETHLKASGVTNLDTLRTYTSACKKILYIAKKDYSKLNKKDIDTIFSSNLMSDTTKALYKMKFVKFLELKNMTNLANYVKSLYNFDALKQPTKTEDDVLSKDEIQLLINSAKSLRDKAIIELFLTTGGRRKELHSLKIKNIKITESIIWIIFPVVKKVKGKIVKSSRRIPVVANKDIVTSIYPENFVNYYNTHMFRNEPEKPVFYSPYSDRFGEPLNMNYITDIIRRIVSNSGLKKRITPHILRHTGATYDGYFLTEKDLCLKYGWRVGSDTSIRYCHMTENQLGDHLLKLSGVTNEQIKKDSICPQCKQIVNINDKFCNHCNYILDRELQQQRIEELLKEKEELNNLKNDIYKLNINHKIEIDKLKEDVSELETISLGLIYMRLMSESIKVKRDPNNKNQIMYSYLEIPDEIKEHLKVFKTTLLKHTNKEIVDTIFKEQRKIFKI